MRDDVQPQRETGADHASAVGAPAKPVRALLLVEIGDFAALRRTLGLADADLVVSLLAERVAATLPEAAIATVGRTRIEIGCTAADHDAVGRAAAALRRAVDQPIEMGEVACRLSVRIGIGTAADGACDALALVEAAEAALARADAGGAAEAGCAPAATATGSDRTIRRELTAALERDELFLQYQPKLHLRRKQVTSIEALIRWRHPERGLVLPGGFIPAAERSGAIRALTLWTLRRVVADQRALARDGHDLPVFVNIAGVLLSDADFVDAAVALVRDSGAKLGFEITETSVIREPETAITHLKRLADIGVDIAIDDYGAGLSSLAYLKQLPARELKIDKLFVTQLSSSHRDPLIVRSTIDLAHALEMEVVAEGVETPTSLALLSVMGCDMVQGFLISRPLVLDSLITFLRDEAHRSLLDEARSPLQRLTAVRARA